jgi:hypothetical protein
MIEQHLHGTTGPHDPQARPQNARQEHGAVRWIGVNDNPAGSRRPDPLHIIGSAHGPRILELLRTS